MTRLLTPLVIANILLGSLAEGLQPSSLSSRNVLENSKAFDTQNKKPVYFSPSGEILDKKPSLHGRFLEITDIHPDPHYKPFTDPESCCHYGKNEDTKFDPKDTGEYGLPASRCDAPPLLVNATFEWIRKYFRDNIDFIVWTGDNVRHDRDRRMPRTEAEIFAANREVIQGFRDVFGTDSPLFPYTIPIIPNIGNNDVYPHNMVVEGPTLQSREFYLLYSGMIPEEQAHIFNKGMYFMKEVIPNKLVVISLNTLFWFDTNPIVDGCDRKQDPGHYQFRWLRVVLAELRARGMKAWLSGHVPPTKDNWEPTCRDRYIAWAHEYRDVVIGGLFGHMNMDHFVIHDVNEAYKQKKREGVAATQTDFSFDRDVMGWLNVFENSGASDNEEQDSRYIKNRQFKAYIDPSDHNQFTAQGKAEYFDALREAYESTAKSEDLDTRYSLSYIHASIIPTYFPGFRVYEYNIDGLEDSEDSLPRTYANGSPFKPWAQVFDELNEYFDLIKQLDIDELDELDSETHELDVSDMLHITKNKRKNNDKKKKKHKKKKKIIDPTWPPEFTTVERGPAYDVQLFTPTKYTQYYANISKANLKGEEFEYEVEYETDKAPYHMESLTMKDWIKLAGNLTRLPVSDGDRKQKKQKMSLWDLYLFYAFESCGYEQEM